MAIDTKISLGGTEYVTDKDTALKLYELLSNNVWLFAQYQSRGLTPLIEHNLEMSPLDSDFEDDMAAAKLIGETYSEYSRNKSNSN
jgi:hypothetical protein